MTGKPIYPNRLICLFIVVGPVALRQVDRVLATLRPEHSLRARCRQCTEAGAREELAGFKSSAFKARNGLPLLVLAVVLPKRVVHIVDIARPLTIPTLGDKAGLAPATLDVLPFDQVEVDDVVHDGLTVGALHLEVPIGLRRLLDRRDIFKLRFDLQVQPSHNTTLINLF